MAIEVTSLKELDVEAVKSAESLLSALIAAYAPGIDTTGALRQLLIQPHAVLYAATRTEIDRVRRSNSLYALARDPLLADREIVDATLSNYALQRKQATLATCMVTITFTGTQPVTIPDTLGFNTPGMSWVPVRTYYLSKNVGDGISRLTYSAHPSGVGFWVQIELIATVPGSVVVESGDKFTYQPLPGLLSVVAAGPATGGQDAETNASLVARAIASISPTSLSTREGVERFIRQNMPAALAVTVVGYGDIELARSRYNMFSISTPGMADIYVRTAEYPNVEVLKVRGFTRVTREQLHIKDLTTHIDVRVEVAGYLHAGAYEVIGMMPVPPSERNVSLQEALDQELTFEPHTHERIAVSDMGVFAPTGKDAAFSAVQGTIYATASIPLNALPASEEATVGVFNTWQKFWQAWYTTQSEDTNEYEKIAAQTVMLNTATQLQTAQVSSPTGAVSSEFTAQFDMWVWVAGLPNIATLHGLITAPSVKAPVDYLVRAMNPCWVTVSLKIQYYEGFDSSISDKLVKAIRSAVIGTTYTATDSVRVSDIAGAVIPILGDKAVLSMPVGLIGRLRLPDDTVVVIDSSTEIKIPAAYASMGVSPRTTAFYIADRDVEIDFEAIR